MSWMIDILREDELVLERPAPPIESLPRVDIQLRAPQSFHRGKAKIAGLLLRLQRCLNREDRAGFGEVYSHLVNEFQPAIRWASSCWEYLLSTQRCKFLPRDPAERKWRRGDYRAFLEPDYQRLIHRVFQNTLVDYVHQVRSLDFSSYLACYFWENIRKAYRDLDIPQDSQQRRLTPYSYLRCAPYQFMNEYHHEKVMALLSSLATHQREAIEYYFLRFFTLESGAGAAQLDETGFVHLIISTMKQIRKRNKLVFALLAQIERY